jgi:hypothetical protein
MLPLESEKPRYTPRQDADRELPILVFFIIHQIEQNDKNLNEKTRIILASIHVVLFSDLLLHAKGAYRGNPHMGPPPEI